MSRWRNYRELFALNIDNEKEKTLALAGVCQAASLVQSVARKGEADIDAFKASINSIVLTDAQSTIEVYGSIENLKLGLGTLIGQLGNTPMQKDAEITRYIASILGLERKLKKSSKKLDELSKRIEQIQRQTLHLDLFDEQMSSNLASVYSDVISPLGAKIQIAGTPNQLKKDANQHRVRALLLSGLRSAVLWRQLGGKRRQILFNRKSIVANALTLQHSIHQSQ
ncbi:high frequency lysogenization protein HflD [Aliiglaciecola sp. 2_MG-2023]|uniref:high frequency lysogenization protein HflD n=1 Tax=unclassified Aliiglaciecola TaxID=2593648 RepID=UPI0026E28940|nr:MULTISPECIES: high frequency lysogenization protein HflD [unclassified Aliiglaciecola]MDO6712133.1 high frequency lysogenization protein HflD [Aliiglaciecola sp. 2_MG-2023]MDO6753213.1 high frequency lysogenization protein HflD [Aliiglaciecola sp. 1_MG-2023]